jgi:hypothetical protein
MWLSGHQRIRHEILGDPLCFSDDGTTLRSDTFVTLYREARRHAANAINSYRSDFRSFADTLDDTHWRSEVFHGSWS